MSFIAAGIGAAGAIGSAVLPKLMGGSSSSTGTQATNQNSSTTSGPQPGSPYEVFQNQQLANINGLSSAPFQPYDISSMFAPINSTQQQAFDQVRGINNGQIKQYTDRGAGILGNYDTVNPITAGAGAFTRAGQQPTALEAANPYMTAAARNWNDPGVQSSYLNPYINNTVNAANQLQSQNFTNNVMPGLNSQFVSSGGGLGSRQYGNAGNAALTNFNQNIGNTTQGALSNAYNSAAGIFANDQARQAGLANTASSAATSGMGALTALGTAQGNNAATGIQSGINQANAWQGLGTGLLNNTLLGSNALLQTGNQIQQNAQNPLTAAYQQNQQSIQWPYQTAGWAANTANQYQWPTLSNTTGGSAGSSGQTNSSTASPIGTGAGLAAAVGSIPGLTSGFNNWLNPIPTPASQGISVGQIGDGSQFPGSKRGGHFADTLRKFARARGGYFGMDASSEPAFGYPPPGYYARGGYLGMDRPSMPSTIPNPGYFKWIESPAFAEGGHFNYAAGGAAPVIKSGRKVTKRDIGAARAKRKAPSGGLTRPLDLSSAATARSGFLSRNANV